MTIAGVLLVPTPEWRERLLGGGPCGARTSTAWRFAVLNESRVETFHAWNPGLSGVPSGSSDALVLAWSGAVVREGRDRAAVVLGGTMYGGGYADTTPSLGWRGTGWALLYQSTAFPLGCVRWDGPEPISANLLAPWVLAAVCEARGLGRVVLVDENGAEVTP